MSIPFNLPIGGVLNHAGRRMRFEGDFGENVLSFIDCRTLARVLVPDEQTGSPVPPDIAWVMREWKAGRLTQETGGNAKSARRNKLKNLDASTRATLDLKYQWKAAWGMAARDAGLLKTDAAYRSFIERTSGQPGFISKFGDPTPSSLRRWVRELGEDGDGPATLVSVAGRAKGSSQLTPLDDALVHEAAIFYWSDRKASIADAYTHLSCERAKLEVERREDLGPSLPSYETVRLRVRSLDTYATRKQKYGDAAADRMFSASGEPIPVTRPFERVFLDGTELEQITVFGEDWPLAASKMKCVYGMDGFTTFVFPPSIFAGPYRQEMSLVAITNVMTPPDLTDEERAEHPWLEWVCQVPDTWVPDNDRTLLGPGMIPGMTELGSTVELPGVYHSDAKATIERLHRFLKEGLRGLPGTVLGPRHQKDLQYDPVADAELTREQLRAIVNARIRQWNTTPSEKLGWRSPLDLQVEGLMAGGGPRLTDPAIIRRALAKTVPDRQLSGNGVEYDGIVYRDDAVVRSFLERNFRDTAPSERRQDAATCTVSIRTYEGDLDSIEVHDPEANGYVTLYSTQPVYTGMLSRWEHREYRRQAKARRERFGTEAQRLRSRARTLRKIDEVAPQLAFRRRNAMAALYEHDEVRRLSGARAATGLDARVPEQFFEVAPMTSMRTDVPRPPPGAKTGGTDGAKRHPAPKRPAGHYELTSGNTPAGPGGGIDWDAVEDDPEDQAGRGPDTLDGAAAWLASADEPAGDDVDADGEDDVDADGEDDDMNDGDVTTGNSL